MKRYREIVVKELSDTKMKLHRICAENKKLRHDLEWKPENPPPPPPLPSSSQSASSSKTSQSGSLVDEVLTKSFSVNCDVDMSDKRQFIASCEDVGDLKKGKI